MTYIAMEGNDLFAYITISTFNFFLDVYIGIQVTFDSVFFRKNSDRFLKYDVFI